MRALVPSLTEIERILFRASDALLARIATGDQTVPADLQRAVEADADAVRTIEELRDAYVASSSPDPKAESASVAIPPHIADLIRRRVAASPEHFSPVPIPGQILSVERVVGPEGDMGWDLSRPLAVMIESPSISDDGVENPEIWYGWMVSPETDYATYWDFVLSDEDEPFDPLAGMVQIWNPVYVYLKSTSRVLGQLRAERLTTVRELANEYLIGSEPDVNDARPGMVAMRTTLGGRCLLTGTPLSGPDDPRWRYQELYHDAAEAIREPARIAAEIRSPPPLWQQLVNAIAAWAFQLDIIFRQRPLAAATMGSDEDSALMEYVLAERVTLRFIERGEYALQMQVGLIRDELLKVMLMQEGQVWQQHRLDPEQRDANFFLDLRKRYRLVVNDIDDKQIFSVPIVAQ